MVKKKSLLEGAVLATRVQKKIKALLTGPTNAGKTTSSLLIAKGLTNGGKVLLVDSENGRSSLQVGDPIFDGWQWTALYWLPEEATSDRLSQVLEEAEEQGFEAVVLDSITHEWDHVNDEHQRLGGRWGDWKDAKIPHKRFVRAVLNSKVHVIMTMRSKMDYEQQLNDKGKKEVVKLGLRPQGDNDFTYEVDFHFMVDEKHRAAIGKTAQGLFTETNSFLITEDTGKRLRAFSEEGEPADLPKRRVLVSRIQEIGQAQQVELPSEEDLLKMTVDELIEFGKKIKEN